MKTSKLLLIVILLLTAGVFVYGQTSTVQSPGPNPISVGQPVAAQIGVDTAQQNLKEVSVTKFEDPGLWSGVMPLDEGIIALRGLPGHPAGAKPLPDAQKIGINIPDDTVLGAKVIFFRRGFSQFSILPEHPIPIEGIVKTISIWVVGRNTNHELSVLLRGMDGEVAKIPIGKLNFVGWKQLTVAVPQSVVQTDYHYSDRSGVDVEGFVVNTAPLEAYGTFYMYFDDMTAVTDLFSQEQRSPDDMSDAW
jgi:hypothetical protein